MTQVQHTYYSLWERGCAKVGNRRKILYMRNKERKERKKVVCWVGCRWMSKSVVILFKRDRKRMGWLVRCCYMWYAPLKRGEKSTKRKQEWKMFYVISYYSYLLSFFNLSTLLLYIIIISCLFVHYHPMTFNRRVGSF